MPIEKTHTLYQYDELSDRAKEKAREWYIGEGYGFDAEFVFEDFETIAGFLGISIRQETVRLMGGGTRSKPAIYYTGFCWQGDGACFEGTWCASDVKPGKLKEHAPQDAELHSIAETFERIARENPEAFFRVVHRGYFYHSLCTSFEFEDDMPEEVCEDLKQAARDLMNWLYSTLQEEYEYQTGEENVAEAIRINGYTFLEDGTLAPRLTNDADRSTRDAEKHEQLMKIGRSAYASIAKMVAALDCDYDRLEELREERAELAAAIADAENEYNEDEARLALAKWDEENGEELRELSEAAGECKDRDEAQQRIDEDPLSIEVRGGWHTPGDSDEPAEFRILLATGGPAVRIIGELDGNKEPSSARLQVQDWFTPWTDYPDADGETLLTYCRCFYFGE